MNYEPQPTDEALDFAWLDMTGDEYAAYQLFASVMDELSNLPIPEE